MTAINNITTSVMKIESAILKKYKYSNEGPHRTPGSYILTHLNSFINDAEKDPEMFELYSKMVLGGSAVLVAAGVSIGIVVTNKYYENKNSKAENSEVLED